MRRANKVSQKDVPPRRRAISDPAAIVAPALGRPARSTLVGVRLPAELAGFDLRQALSALNGNRHLHAELLLQFVSEYCDCAASIARSLSSLRPAEAAATLHRLRGAALIVGARDVADAARDLEHEVMRGAAPSVARLRDSVHAATALIWANVALQEQSDDSARATFDGRPRVLAVDDEPINLRVLVDALGSEYRMLVASDGPEALGIVAAEHPPDIVLLDIRMPGMDGYEVCRRLKEQASTRDIPVIFVTTLDDVEEEAHGLDIGAIDYITKPVNPRVLQARVRAHLNAKGTQDRITALSRTDELTGIANRRRFDEALGVEWRRNLRQRTPLALVMCDIDYFKAFNDRHGHVAGDRCLRRVALAIAGAMRRPSDIVARYGGEEFAALLPDTDAAGARLVAEAMRVNVAGAGLIDGSGTGEGVTLSCGFACVVPSDEVVLPMTLVELADARLYEAKAAGRDRVVG